jgi:SAM-dependent methyltransferase
MLVEHLSQEHDLASRRSETIDRHVGWIQSEVLGLRHAKVLDLGCGPGFYTTRLARLGCECIGIDFSPASIRYAREVADAEKDLSCTYHQADVRNTPYGRGFDLVMMIYGQFNVFPRDRGLEILRKAHGALKPGGSLLLEIQNADEIRKEGEQDPSWYSAQSGLFSEAAHLVLRENFWHAAARASTTRWMIIDAETGAVSNYALSNEAYTERELTDALSLAGFTDVRMFPTLSGKSVGGEQHLPVAVARR